MNRLIDWLMILAVLVAGVIVVGHFVPPPEPPTAPAQPTAPSQPAPQPCPPDKPCPPKKPWGVVVSPARAVGSPLSLGSIGGAVGGPKHADGTEVSCDYPGERHRKNTASKGLGLCVFTSIHHAADWQDVPALLEMPKWLVAKGIPGGGYPSKVQALIPRLSQERGMPTPDFLQIESNDLEVLKLACASGRMPCVTYAYSPTGRYGGRRIAHMVNLVHMDDRHAVILDNNYPGEQAYEWMTHAEFLRAYGGGGTGWAVILTDAPPPPPPHNGQPAPKRDVEPVPSPVQPTPQPSPCSSECTCGCSQGLPCRCGPPLPDPDVTGVEWDRIGKPRYRHGQYEVTREDVVAAIAASVPADGKRRRLTVIGSQPDRDRVAADWKTDPGLAAVRDGYIFRAYDPSHWHVSKFGFKTDGRPTIYVQEPDGKVLHRQDDYDGAASLTTALRRLRPDYDPAKDRVGGSLLGRRSAGPPWGTILLVGGAGLAAVYFARRRKGGVS